MTSQWLVLAKIWLLAIALPPRRHQVGGPLHLGKAKVAQGDYHSAAGWDSRIKMLIISTICRLLEQEKR